MMADLGQGNDLRSTMLERSGLSGTEAHHVHPKRSKQESQGEIQPQPKGLETYS